MPQIPQTDPRANYLAHKAKIDIAIQRVLESGWYILGKEVETFEQAFAAYIGVSHAIGVASGTDALELALRACGVGPGDLVFTVSHTAVATIVAIELVGATPVLVDIDPMTYTLDPNCLEEALVYPPTGRPKAVIPVHLYGQPADMVAILELAHRYGLYVIEDCAQSHGATLEGRMTGAWSDIAAFSFYPTKNLAALGDGGMVVTPNTKLAEHTRSLRQYGWRRRYISEIPGCNSRLDELQAAILRVKLEYLEAENARRNALAARYTTVLTDSGLTLPVCRENARHVYHQYVVRSPHRDALQGYLRSQGIGTLVHYPMAIHQQPAYKGRIPITGALPHSERSSAEVLSLPIYPELTDEQVDFVAEACHNWGQS
ncbi:MAG: DegT/DnrJ/EryC1/StrS family aminotransferase [Anaerolineales bacterium]|jgi:dTDP-4-amino-4,6-dideoxygalactose transaminase